ncbi:MAG: murein biosynthesis integral membrane protein MurJ [Candidatus Omnitrophica bacterium]|nr:murein biosynthesis integral membrane protein MurJ [Candidatus Omnitrophota bacterium]
MSNKKLIRSTWIISSATTASRVLGFLRDILIAQQFGTGIFAQAFVVAFRLPNMLRDMVGEGATNAAIVPILTEYRHVRSREEYWEVARIILNMMLVVLVLLSVAGVVFAPLLVRIIAPGFVRSPEMFSTTVMLTRIIFPYILLLGMVAYSKGVLNSFHYFTAPAFAPVVLNATMILALLVLCPIIGIKGLVAGVLLGGIFEVLIQVHPLRKRGFRLEKNFRLVHPIVKRIGKLLLPRAVGTAVYQISVLIDTMLASFAWIVGPGGIAALYYSNRLVQLPLAVFGISLATAALPKMTKEVASNDMEALKSTISFSLRTVFTIMIPAAVGLMILAEPIVRILFQRGEFTGYSTSITTSALFFYSIGLFAYAGIKILVGAYYSMGDTRTPVKTASMALGVNLVLNLILMWPLKIGGLALATSIAAITNFMVLYVILRRRIGDVGTSRIVSSFLRTCAASLVMGVFTFFMLQVFLRVTGLSSIMYFARLMFMVFLSGIIYLISAYLLGVESVRKMFRLAAVKMRILRKEN